MTAEKKKLSEAGRTIPDVTVGADHEKTLRKTATRGGMVTIALVASFLLIFERLECLSPWLRITVVQLFNAIKAAQKTLERVQSDGIQKHIEEGK